tara:strand:+ start:1673 stop:2104 length:432 start_codon:yes stop_codon:yes gene_type:complete
MKFDQAINEGYGRYVSDQESKMIPVSEDVLKRAAKVAYNALGSTTYGENPDLMKLYQHTYLDLKQALKSAGVEHSEDEDFEDLEGVTDETEKEAEEFDSNSASDLSKALSLGKQLKSPEVAQATKELHGKVAQKIKDETSKLS